MGGHGGTGTPPVRLPLLRSLLLLLARFGLGRKDAPGARGESLAAKFLETQGYRVECRNFRIKGGEADIIATRDGLVVVVEVKTRSSARFGSPAQAVDGRKGRRVIRAGRAYCRAKGLSLSKLRGDLVAVELPPGGGTPHIRHYRGVITDPDRG